MKKTVLIIILFFSVLSFAQAQNDTITATSNDTIYSGYSATCFQGGCTYHLSVPVPANFTITNVLYSFDYSATGTCNLNQAAWSLNYGACRSPANSNEWHTCAIAMSGKCINENISCYDDIEACIPPPQQAGYNMDFILTFYRCGSPGAGCGFSCFTADTTWRMTIVGTDTSTGIIESSLSNFFSIYPNPANTQLTLYSSFIHPDETITVSITNILGETMLSFPSLHWRGGEGEELNIKALPSGIYFVQVQNENGRWVQRFVKE